MPLWMFSKRRQKRRWAEFSMELERVRRWSHQQQQLGKAAVSGERALREVIAVYSAHPTAPLSLFPRVKKLDAGKFRALEQERRAVRLGAMRGSIHLMPRETAPQIFYATAGENPKMVEFRLKVAQVTPDEYAKFKASVLKNVREPMTVRALKTATKETKTGLGTLLRAMSDEALVLRVGAAGLRSNDLNYVPVKNWLGKELPRAEKESSLVWLAREYLRAFGPVRLQDFMWWTANTKSTATKIFSQIETVAVGDGYLLLKEHERAFSRIKPLASDVIDVLPKWDCYEMGYAPDGRGRFVTPDMQTRLYDLVGDGVGAILLNGLAVAAWDLKSVKDVLEVNIDWFEKPTARLKQAVVAEMEAIGMYLESKSVRIKHLGDEHASRALGRMR